jgi:hypothetical protein
LYFEKYIPELIENYTPKTHGDEEEVQNIVNVLKIASSYVQKLVIRQLRPTEPPELNPKSNKTEGGPSKEPPKELVIKPTDPPPNHFDTSLLFNHLSNLQELSVNYGVKDCGINFNWSYFGMTIWDAQRLADSIRGHPKLVSLNIGSSGMDDDKCRILASALNQNVVLSRLCK